MGILLCSTPGPIIFRDFFPPEVIGYGIYCPTRVMLHLLSYFPTRFHLGLLFYYTMATVCLVYPRKEMKSI